MRTCTHHRPAQWAFVLEHFSKIAEAHPAAAGWAADEMIGLVFGRIAGSAADVFAARYFSHFCVAGSTVNWLVCKSLTATLLPGF